MSTDAEADFRLAWRWLLPTDGVCAVHTNGLSAADEEFLRGWLGGAGAAKRRTGGELWIIAADSGAAPADALPGLTRAVTVGVYGRGDAVSPWARALGPGFQSVRQYALLPADNPRVVVPLGSRRDTMAGLGLHRPGRQIARIALAGAQVMARFGSVRPLRRQVLCVASRQGDAAPSGARECDLARHLGTVPGDYALYLGAPSGARKTTVLPLSNGPIGTLVKIANEPEARIALQTEADTLTALAATDIGSSVPRCLHCHDGPYALAVYEEYRARRPMRGALLENAAVRFLAQLGRTTALEKGFPSEFCASHAPDQGGAAAVVSRLHDAALTGRPFWTCRTHGDFAPWNCAWTDRGLFVYDWESSEPHGTFLGDAFYFKLGPAFLVGVRDSPQELMASALSFARRVARAAGLAKADARLQLGVWLLRQRTRQGGAFYTRLLEALGHEWPRHA